MSLQNIWFFLVAFLLTGYVVLDGFDLGAGVLIAIGLSLIGKAVGQTWVRALSPVLDSKREAGGPTRQLAERTFEL